MKAVPLPSLPRDTFNLVVFDIEAVSLNSHEFILCCGFKPLGHKAYVIGLSDMPILDDPLRLDATLVTEIKRHLEYYDGWITWNGSRYDIPMINDRLLMAGHGPLVPRFHIDLIKEVRWPRSRTQSASLDWCAKQFGCPWEKTPLRIMDWMKARDEAIVATKIRGKSRWSLGMEKYNEVVKHNKADLDVTSWMFGLLKPKLRGISRAA